MPENSNRSNSELPDESVELAEAIRAERPRLGRATADGSQAAPPPPPPLPGEADTLPGAPASIAGIPPSPDPESCKRSISLLVRGIANLPAAARPEKLGWLYLDDPTSARIAALLWEAFPELSILDQFRAVKILACMLGISNILIEQKRKWDGGHPPPGAPAKIIEMRPRPAAPADDAIAGDVGQRAA